MFGWGPDQGAAAMVVAVLRSPRRSGEGKPNARWRLHRKADPQTRAIRLEPPVFVAQYYMTLLGEDENGNKTEANYCVAIHDIAVGEVDTELVLSVLKPIWHDKPETAARLRGRIEKVIGYAMIHGLCDEGPNPARWRGHIENALPSKGEVRDTRHHAALAPAELPAFYAQLRQREGLAARCLELAILCAVRTGDLIGNDREDRPPMKREHINLQDRMWTIPRTKNGTEHRVPLSDGACALLARVLAEHGEDIVFPGDRRGEPLSNGAMLRVRDRMVKDGLIRKGAMTTHGARATFKTWASESTDFQRDVIESALTHTISDKLEAAYRRGDFYAKRVRLMAQWADFIEGKAASNVLRMHG